MRTLPACIATLVLGATLSAIAAPQTDTPPPVLPPSNGPIYGSQLMTPEERTEQRSRMLNATSDQEREHLRAEHHEQMKQRGQAQGITLPDQPPPAPRQAQRGARGGGKVGPGAGMGQGRGGPPAP